MPKMTTQTRAVLAAFLRDPDAELYGLQVLKATGLERGTAYPILNRLAREGWLASRVEPKRGEPGYVTRNHGGPPRRYYRFTSRGWEAAQQESAMIRSRKPKKGPKTY